MLMVNLILNFCKLPGLQIEEQEMETYEVLVSEVLFEAEEDSTILNILKNSFTYKG